MPHCLHGDRVHHRLRQQRRLRADGCRADDAGWNIQPAQAGCLYIVVLHDHVPMCLFSSSPVGATPASPRSCHRSTRKNRKSKNTTIPPPYPVSIISTHPGCQHNYPILDNSENTRFSLPANGLSKEQAHFQTDRCNS